MIITKVGIVVVTHNRYSHLLKCVGSLERQLTKNDDIYVIDNNSDEKKTVKGRNLKYIRLSSNSIAKARNIGFKLCKDYRKDLCVYIDDDCIPKNDWLKQIKKVHMANKQITAISGRIVNPDHNNIYGTIHNELSKAWILKSNSIDTKNVSIKVKYINTSHPFDKKREVYKREDTIFSDYLHSMNLKIAYSERIVAFHLEKDNLRDYLRKRVSIVNTSEEAKAKLFDIPYKNKFQLSPHEELPIISRIIISELRYLRIFNVFKTVILCILMVLVKTNAKLSLYKK